MYRFRCCAMVILALCTTLPASAAESTPPVVKLDRITVEARATQSARLTVDAFGRYAVTATSAQGVALQLVDRMAGTGQLNGEPGQQDGRLDLFLDRGEYKIVTQASSAGKGNATLAAHAFRELQAPAPLLVENRLERAALGDFEQRSYWIEIKEKRSVALEAAGRHLADLRLWRDGTWLVAAVPQLVQNQAKSGQPLLVARLTAELPPGLYLLTAYGGPSQVWTEASTEKPFFLRFGIPVMPSIMRRQFTMSEFGTDRFLIPKGPDYFRLELPKAHEATMQVGNYAADNPFQANGQSVSIDKRSMPPVAEVDALNRNDLKLVTVSMAAGETYVLQHFEANTTRSIAEYGEHWISSIHAGPMEDSVGATAVLTRQRRHERNEEYVDDQVLKFDRNSPWRTGLAALGNNALLDRVLKIGGDAPWHRRFNLLGDLTLFVKLPEATKIRVVGKGVKARYRFEPFLISRPRDYKAPAWRDSGAEFELDQGFHVLTITPETKGILDLQLLTAGSVASEALSPINPVARFPSVTLESNATYTVYLNRQPGVVSGIVVRRLPIDLASPLPVTLRAGETLTIPVVVPEAGTLQALLEDGNTLDIGLDNGKSGKAIKVDAGRYNVVLKAADAMRNFSLGFQSTRLASSTPLPAVPDARLAALPKFPVITPDVPRYVDLDRNSTAVQSVRVDKPGLYQFESTGLLNTKGIVRTRINPSLFDADGNGVGRNFMIQRYVREGDYQLSVSTLGETKGHLGINLARSEMIDGGELREGQAARAVLPTAQAIAYRFSIAQRGAYHLQTLGLGRNFDIRLEDDDGWPLGDPVRRGDLTQQFEPGNYRVIVLPQTSEARVIARLDRVPEPKRYKGHGPHRVALDATIAHTWIEPSRKKSARVPDRWAFSLPAPADVTIAIDNEMEATLVSATDRKRSVLARLDAQRAWRGRLPAGRYLVQARNSRANNHVPYTLRISPTQLLAGQSRIVTAPASIPLSVGADGLIELQSFGASDVRARLLDSGDNVVAQNDDRPGDWNFQIAQRLRPGEYRLMLDPVNEKVAQAMVSMHAPAEVLEKPLAFGADTGIADANVHIYPLTIPADRNILLVSAQSSDVVGIALEGESANGWVNLGNAMEKAPHLVLPLPAGSERFKSYRLRGWSVDRRSMQMRLRAVAATLPAIPESRWLQGISATRIDDAVPSLRVAMVALTRPGAFRIKGDLSRLQWSDHGARTAAGRNSAVMTVSGKTLWLLSEEAKSGDSTVLAADRLYLPTVEQDALRLELAAGDTGVVDLLKHQGPSLVLAQSRVGQPGITLGESPDLHTMGLVPGEAVAVALPGAVPSATVWNAANRAASLELDVRQVPFHLGSAQTPGFGLSDGAIKSRAALPIKLPPGALRVRLTLLPMHAAVFLKRGVIQSTHWSGVDPLYESVFTDADQLWLLNANPQDAHYSVEIAPGIAEAEQPLKAGDLLERNVSTAGRLRIPIDIPQREANGSSHAAAEPYTIRVRGNTQAIWIENGGRIASGSDIVIRDSGMLSLQHQPGTLIAWIDAPREAGAARIAGWLKSIAETSVKPPQSVSLQGKQQVLGFNLERAAMLHIRTSVPVVTQFVVAGESPQTEAHLFGANINLVAPPGASRLMLRAVGADSLSGVATVMLTTVTALSDGAGPEVLLAPGSARLFSFEIKQKRAIGIGVRASSDVVRSVLYNERGVAQSEGVVQMPTLEPGRYYIAIDLPADSAPVKAQPIILGLKEPDTRPPLDILRRYVESKNEEPLLYVPPPPEPEAPQDNTEDNAEEASTSSDDDTPKEQDESENSESGNDEDNQ